MKFSRGWSVEEYQFSISLNVGDILNENLAIYLEYNARSASLYGSEKYHDDFRIPRVTSMNDTIREG